VKHFFKLAMDCRTVVSCYYGLARTAVYSQGV